MYCDRNDFCMQVVCRSFCVSLVGPLFLVVLTSMICLVRPPI